MYSQWFFPFDEVSLESILSHNHFYELDFTAEGVSVKSDVRYMFWAERIIYSNKEWVKRVNHGIFLCKSSFFNNWNKIESLELNRTSDLQ